METLHFYIDESYCHVGHEWHCNIGGTLLPSTKILDAEIALETCLFELSQADARFPFNQEFKYSAFFRDAPDELKVKACEGLTSVVNKIGAEFLVSHAKIAAHKLNNLSAFGPPQHAIQHLAHINISHSLAEPAKQHLIQTIVDLGLSESFRPVYEIYSASSRGLKAIKAQGIADVHISVPHYRNLLPPAFIASQDSRLLQFSDLLIGLFLAQETGRLTPFKESLLACLEPLKHRVKVVSVEWNKNDA